MEKDPRIFLQKGQELALSVYEDGSSPDIYTIQSVVGKGGSTVCYEATRRRNGYVETGKLKEFYPLDAEDIGQWYSLERLENGILVPCRGTIRRFGEMCSEYVGSYRKLLETINDNPDNEILKNYIQHGEILYSCMSEETKESGLIGKIINKFGAEKENDIPRRGTVYVWTPGEKGKTFGEYLSEVRMKPGARPDHTLYDILATIHTITDSIRAIHIAGLLHLDIKPTNFLVAFDSNFRINPNRVSIFDINTLHQVEAELPYAQGTEGFTAPEMLRRDVDNRTDIYAIGAMLFNAIVVSDEVKDGLYRDEYYGNIEQLVRHSKLILEAESNSNVRLVSQLVRILRKCLAVRPAMRYKSCTALLQDLKNAEDKIKEYTKLRSEKKGKTDPEIVMQKLLYEKPLYEGMQQPGGDIDVLVVGAGTYGQKFIDVCLQAGQIKDTRLTIRAVSNTPEEDAGLYLQFRPALTEFVDVYVGDKCLRAIDDSYGRLLFAPIGTDNGGLMEFRRNDHENNERLVGKILDDAAYAGRKYRYVFIALGNDKLNKSIADMFAARSVGCPICFVSERTCKASKAEKAADLYPVCVNEEITPDTIDANLERMAFNAHLAWKSSMNIDIQAEYEAFLANRYNYASSMAYALSVKYKLFSVGIDTGNGLMEAAKRFDEEVLGAAETDHFANRKYVTLIALEHRRWVLNYVTAGWTAPRDERGRMRYDDFVAMGKDNDKANRTHLCLVHSMEDMPLSGDDYSENDHAKWNEGKIDPALDELDRVSVELHRHYRKAADEYRAKQPLKGEDMQHIWKLISGEGENVSYAFRQYQFCLKNILNGVESYTRQHDYYLGQLRASLAALAPDVKEDIEKRLELITTAFYPVIRSNLYKNFKLNDVALISKMPFILTYHPRSSMAMAFEDGRYQNGRNEAVFANVASATLLSPGNIYYLYSYNADSRPELLERKLRSVINYLDNRNVHTNVTMIIAWQVPDKGQKDQLKQSLEAIRDRSISGNGKAVFDDYEIIDCADTKEAAERLLDALKDKNVDLFDGTARLFDSQIGNSTMLSGLFARGVSYFELDWRRKQFRECSGCEYLKYIRDDSYVRISDMFALMNAVDNSFNLPEFAEDYETLWSIYTGKAGGDTPYETAVSSWNKTCGLLAAYEEARNPVVALEMPALHESTTSHTAFLPEFAYSKLDEIIAELISCGLIEEGSSVTGYTSDTCRVDIISTDTVWNRLKASFATPHLFMGYYGMHVCKKGRLTEMRCSAPRVSGLDITSGGSRDAVAVMNVLSLLDKAGFIVNLVRSKENRDLVSFSYSSPRIKKLLTTEGEILEVYIYYELLRSGLFDDIACGYEFRWENGGVMNELDCVLVKGFRTIIVECKATKLLKLEHYHKLHSLADHFGIGATKVLVGNTYRDGDAINEQRNDVQRSRGDQLNIITISSREEIENIAETMKKILEKA